LFKTILFFNDPPFFLAHGGMEAGAWRFPNGCGDLSFVRHVETQRARPGLKSQK
jgi:hypothetical protein